MTSPIDELDARLIALMRDEPRIGLMEAARRLDVARGTVQARLAKLTERGVIRGFGPEIDPSKIGYPVLAFVFLQITQGRLIEAVALLDGARGARGHGDERPARPALPDRRARHRAPAGDRQPPAHTSAIRRSTSYIVLSTADRLPHGPLVQAAAEQ